MEIVLMFSDFQDLYFLTLNHRFVDSLSYSSFEIFLPWNADFVDGLSFIYDLVDLKCRLFWCFLVIRIDTVSYFELLISWLKIFLILNYEFVD